ncbi:MAG: family transcriptional regulator, cyclic receptor protein [Verrucomicrobiota bacterium]|jgi:CRP-like cAMP-binding protein
MKEDTRPADRPDLEARVAAHPFLIGMNAHQIELLIDCVLLTRFEAGRTIFRTGETANRFYLIESGAVTLEAVSLHESPIVIDTVSAGDLLGWSWLFPPYLWHFTARAIKPTSAIFFYGTVLRQYCERDPALGYELFKRMSEVMMRRLQAARVALSEAMKNVPVAV